MNDRFENDPFPLFSDWAEQTDRQLMAEEEAKRLPLLAEVEEMGMHPFESAGLGLAPFRLAGDATPTNEPMVCNVCGRPKTRGVYRVVSRDGLHRRACLECIRRSGQVTLIKIAEEAEEDRKRITRRESRRRRQEKQS